MLLCTNIAHTKHTGLLVKEPQQIHSFRLDFFCKK